MAEGMEWGATALMHEDVRDWFRNRFEAPTEAQTGAWPLISTGKSVLLAAPTGSGKTMAAFLFAISKLWRAGLEGDLPRKTKVLYVSPLKALTHDVKKNLEEPLREIRERSLREQVRTVDIAVAARTGDTPSVEREAMRREPPHILVTTPESLYLLLTSRKGRDMLKTVETVIVDEVHALAGNRRGAHLALSLERLETLAECPGGLQRIGLSATQKPLELVADFLVGNGRPCSIVDAGRRRDFDIDVEVPPSGLEAVMALEVWEEVYARLLQLIEGHRTTLIFTNTRRMAERMAHRLRQSLGDERVASHHGSMSRERRLDAEQRLKAGTLRAMVATSSLELGIDIGSVDLVAQMGSPRSINAFLQRIGRSRHHVGGKPKARIFPLTRDELVEAVALFRAVRQGELDALSIPESPLDVLAQQIVAESACREWGTEAFYQMVKRAQPYRNLTPEKFAEILLILSQGYATRRGRRGAHIHFDAVNGRLRGRPAARLTALMNGGAIPDNFDYEVRLEPGDQFLGTVHEDFAVESTPGDVFLLGNGTWRILRVENNALRVADAQGEAPSLPFWLGEGPGRSPELSHAVSDLRREIAQRLGTTGSLRERLSLQGSGPEAAWKPEILDWMVGETGMLRVAVNMALDHLASAYLALGALPTNENLVAERFFDAGGGMHLVIHAPFGSRVNRAFGLSLRKRFCRKFNFELQAAATDEGIILSLGASHSFALEEVFQYLRAATVRPILEQAVLQSPIFEVRWRWNATRFLAIARRQAKGRVPPAIQRLQAQDLSALVFPDQLACPENLGGDREIPDHPLVRQTLDDCLHEAMDIDGLEFRLGQIENGNCRFTTCDVSEPSALAEELLNARPYAFLDDAPLEERRTRAVSARAQGDPARVLSAALDPEAVQSICDSAWPSPRSPDELHEALWMGSFLSQIEISTGWQGISWSPWLEPLQAENRVGSLVLPNGSTVWIASERWAEALVALPHAKSKSIPALPPTLSSFAGSPENALKEMIRGRLEIGGPVSVSQMARILELPETDLLPTFAALEAEGFIFQGEFPGFSGVLWCERRLLHRMRQLSAHRRRQSVITVAAEQFQEFLFVWQGLRRKESGTSDTLAATLENLEGFHAPAALWEKELLPRRVPGFDPAWLDRLNHTGRTGCARLSALASEISSSSPFLSLRQMPLAFYLRSNLRIWKRLSGNGESVGAPTRSAPTDSLTGHASILREILKARGASFADDLAIDSRLLPEELERGLRSLIHSGLAACDAFEGMRSLMRPSRVRLSGSGWKAGGRRQLPSGRFFLLPTEVPAALALEAEEDRLFAARILLRRYGVVFRRLAERSAEDGLMPPWRELRRALRTLEDRGEVRAGRFIAGISGEQFASLDALELLYRDSSEKNETLVLSAADPANLQGILTPERRVPLHPKNRLLFVGGLPMLALEKGEVRVLNSSATEELIRTWKQRLKYPAGAVYFASAATVESNLAS